jgi:hypothetical protein
MPGTPGMTPIVITPFLPCISTGMPPELLPGIWGCQEAKTQIYLLQNSGA